MSGESLIKWRPFKIFKRLNEKDIFLVNFAKIAKDQTCYLTEVQYFD